jgi:predicted SPOUT superfamily RNA methylase MTH1
MTFSAFKQNVQYHYFENQDGNASLNKKELCIAIPASVVSDTPHLREKTSKIGLIGRAAAIFRVDEIIIYPDNARVSQASDMDLAATLLRYMETPQYLRKRLFKLEPELQYAGILPPLRTPHHPLNRKMKDLRVGEYREGVTLSTTEGGTLIDVGVEHPALFTGKLLPQNKRFTMKVTRVDSQVEVDLTSRDEIGDYWGYMVSVEPNSFGKMMKKRGFDLTIATSKYGSQFADVAQEIGERWRRAKSILVAFGAPTRGLNEIVERGGQSLKEIVDFVVNTIPMQGTETVRTEEALIASLATLNISLQQVKK